MSAHWRTLTEICSVLRKETVRFRAGVFPHVTELVTLSLCFSVCLSVGEMPGKVGTERLEEGARMGPDDSLGPGQIWAGQGTWGGEKEKSDSTGEPTWTDTVGLIQPAQQYQKLIQELIK